MVKIKQIFKLKTREVTMHLQIHNFQDMLQTVNILSEAQSFPSKGLI